MSESTAVATIEHMSPALAALTRDPLVDAINVFAQSMDLARTLHASGFLPKSIKSPEQALAVMLTGREMGIGPMQSIRSIAIVDAKPVVAADLQLARFKAEGGHAVFAQLDDTGAVLQLRHPNGDEHTESFSIDDARKAQLLGKDNWKKFPKAMLRSRVITAGLKSIGFEPVAGVYDPDEADHFRPAAPAVQQAKASVAQDETIVDAEVVDDDGVVHDLDWAMRYPFPFKRGTDIHGKPLRELSNGHLESIMKWIVDKREENRDEEWNAEPYAAMKLVVDARNSDPSQAKMDLGGAPPAVPAAVDSTLKPGKIEDAVPLERRAPGLTELSKSIERLLSHQKLSDDERATFREKLGTADTVEAMQLLIVDIETLIEQPF